MKNFKIGRGIIVCEYLGCIGGSMTFVVRSDLKKSIHRISPQLILDKSDEYDE